jgi:hypothetical protein
LCLLQGLNTLNDQQALDAFGFDIRWRCALESTSPMRIYHGVPWSNSEDAYPEDCH